jgi:integrase/recombinase XerD
MPPPGVGKLLPPFGDYLKAKGYAPLTRRAYRWALPHFFAYLETKGVTEIVKIKREHLFAWHSKLINARKRDGAPLHAGSIGVRLAAVKTFFAFLTDTDRLLTNPASCLKLPKVPREIKREPLTEAEMTAFLKAIPTATIKGYRDRTLAEVLYATGIRVSELMALGLGDVHLQEKILVVRKGKGGKGRIVPLSAWAVSYLKGYLKTIRPKLQTDQSGQLLFLNLRGRALDEDTLCDLLKDYAKRAGIEKPVTPHVFRHTFATHLLKHGADLRAIQEMMGHEQVTTTQVYTRVEISDLKAVLQKCHPRERYRSRVPDTPSTLTAFYFTRRSHRIALDSE